MSDIWSLMQWWDDWQLRVLVLGSLSLQWFLLLAAPMRKYSVPHLFRTCIWLAYISSDAVAIYALATLFNRHARTVPASYCPTPPAGKEQSRILEVLWAPILLIHLGGQEEMTAYEIEDNELWRRHTVTVVSQVTVALYAFYKSWQPSSSDVKLTASAVLLFIIGVVSFSEKPLALNRAKIKRLADVSAMIQGTKNRTVLIESLMHVSLFEESNPFGLLKQRNSTTTGLLGRAWCFRRNGDRRKEKKGVAMSAGDKVLMVLSDMSLLAAAKELVERKKAEKVEDVLPPILFASDDEQPRLQQWLRGAFAFIYTKASVMVSPIYLVYHLALVPVLHVAALTLFATSDKRRYRRTDVKITYIILCLTAALDFLAVFVRLLVYQFMSMTKVPPLCETLPSYSLIDEAVREGDPYIGWVYKFARSTIGWTCNRPRHRELYQEVEATVLADLVDGSQDRDLASYRIFDSSTTDNWALSKELQASCGQEIRANLGISFDRSVLLWHIATDLCFRCSEVVVHDDDDDDDDDEQDGEEAAPGEGEGGGGEGEGGGGGGEGEGEEIELEDGGARHRSKANAELRLHIKCTEAISSYMGHLLNSNPEMLMTGSRHHLISESRKGVQSTILKNRAIRNWLASGGCGLSCSCASTGSSCICGQMNRSHHFSQPKEQLKKFVSEMADRRVNFAKNSKDFQIITACRLAKELMEIQDDSTRWKLMYKVWIGMLFYSASMCRGYLHAKSLGEGGEFLSFVWLVLSLKGAQTLADKLQLPPKPTTKPL